ncbi:MAG: nitrate- and nitrite sensing domain-containing protein [Rickettsiales bacterium]
MLKFISNLKISVAIFSLVAGALIAIMILSSQIIMGDMTKLSGINKMSQLVELSTKLSNLLHEQQKERGYTGVFVGSGGTKLESELNKQRSDTNEKKQELESFLTNFDNKAYDNEFNKLFKSVMSDLDKMDSTRSSISSLSLAKADAIGYYSSLNAKIINLVAYTANLSPDPQVALAIVAFSNFMQGKEFSGIERAVGAGGFGAKVFSEAEINKIKSLISSQKAYEKVFLSYASDEQKKLYDNVLSSSATKEVARMEDIITNNVPEEVSAVDGGYWVSTITKKIDGMREVEESFADTLLTKMSHSLKEASSSQMSNITIIAITTALIVIFSYAIARALVKSLNVVATATEELAEGNLNTNLPPRTNNEVGKIVSALEIFKENALQMEKMKQEQAEQEKIAAERKRQEMTKMADSFEQSVKGAVSQVASSAAQMQSGAESVTHIAEDTKTRSTIVVNASNEAAQTSTQVASAAEELTASIKEISDQTQKSSQIANDAASKAEYARDAINLLSERSASVAQIIEVITGIAGQINLLALNATIESARAGEAGKGFAVVASEVKNLANQVGKATDEITQQINEMQNATKTSVDSVMDIANIISQVSSSTSAVATAVEEQSAVTREIAHNVARTSSGTQEISQNMVSVQEGAEKTGSTAIQVLDSAKNLNQQSEILKQKVDEFLQTIRTA